MKWIAIALLLTSFPSTIPAKAASLRSDMSEIGKLFKNITRAVGDASKNAASAVQAKRLGALFRDSQSITPDSISQLPGGERAKALADYRSLLQQEIDAAAELEAAFLKNNNVSAATILSDMQAPKAEGHQKYK